MEDNKIRFQKEELLIIIIQIVTTDSTYFQSIWGCQQKHMRYPAINDLQNIAYVFFFLNCIVYIDLYCEITKWDKNLCNKKYNKHCVGSFANTCEHFISLCKPVAHKANRSMNFSKTRLWSVYVSLPVNYNLPIL